MLRGVIDLKAYSVQLKTFPQVLYTRMRQCTCRLSLRTSCDMSPDFVHILEVCCGIERSYALRPQGQVLMRYEKSANLGVRPSLWSFKVLVRHSIKWGIQLHLCIGCMIQNVCGYSLVLLTRLL